MNRTSIIQGIAHWAADEFAPKMPSLSPIRVGLWTIDRLAQMAPAAAEAMAMSLPFGPVMQAILAGAEVDFDATMKALEESVAKEGSLVLAWQTKLGPITFTLAPASIGAIKKHIETAEANNKAGAIQ